MNVDNLDEAVEQLTARFQQVRELQRDGGDVDLPVQHHVLPVRAYHGRHQAREVIIYREEYS